MVEVFVLFQHILRSARVPRTVQTIYLPRPWEEVTEEQENLFDVFPVPKKKAYVFCDLVNFSTKF